MASRSLRVSQATVDDARQIVFERLIAAGDPKIASSAEPRAVAVRDLCRCREDVRADLARCRHRLVKMLVRRGLAFNSSSRLWSQAHRRWRQGVTFDNEVDRVVFAEYCVAIEQAERRLQTMDIGE